MNNLPWFERNLKFGYPKEKANTLVEMILANIQNKQNPDETMKRVEMLIK